jgi:hypothetical protein
MLTLMIAKLSKPQDIELEPDAWPRFERFIREIAKAGPQHRAPKPKVKTAKSPSGKRKEASKSG